MQQTIIDEAVLNDLKDIMGEDFQQLVTTFIQDSIERLSKLSAAIAANDNEQVRFIAHGFKGSALNLSALELTELCRQLEAMGRDNQLAQALPTLEAIRAAFARVQEKLSQV